MTIMDALEAAVVFADQRLGCSGAVGFHPPVPIDCMSPFGEEKGYAPLFHAHRDGSLQGRRRVVAGA